jgi:hypothetical protein
VKTGFLRTGYFVLNFFENQVNSIREIESSSQGNKVKLPICEDLSIIKQFSMFFSFLNKLSNFCVIGHANWTATNVL